MVLELHVWGPAFGLPSVDPACLAAVAYFNRIVPHGQWILVADYDSLSGRQGKVICTWLFFTVSQQDRRFSVARRLRCKG